MKKLLFWDNGFKLLGGEVLDFPVKENDNFLSLVIGFGIGHERDALFCIFNWRLGLPIDVMVPRALLLNFVQMPLSIFIHGVLLFEKRVQFRRSRKNIVV